MKALLRRRLGVTPWLSLSLILGALLLPASAGSSAAGVGGPVPTSPPAGQPPPAKSYPPDLTPYQRPAIPADYRAAVALPPGYSLVDTVVSNTDPNLSPNDTWGDSEPSLAINGANSNQLAIHAFSSRWVNGNASIWYSTDGGATWTKQFTWPQPTGVAVNGNCPCDVTVDYDRSSRLFGTVLNGSGFPGDVYTGDTTNPANAGAWQWFAPGGITQKTDTFNGGANDADQPWLRITRDPVTATQDNAFVAYDDFTSPEAIRVAVAPGSAPPNFTRNQQPGIPGCCVNPGTRLAAYHGNGTMYVLWQYATGQNPDGSKAVQYALSRSTDGGQSWSLNGSNSGIVVANANSDQPQPKFGSVNALLGGVDHASVDPTNGDVYYVYGTKSATGNNRLAIRRLTSNGQGGLNIGSERFVTGEVQAALPSVAVASNRTIGVLYYTFDGFDPSGFPAFSTHLAQSVDQGQTFSDVTLLSFLSPVKDNADPKQRVLGDYINLRALGETFYGVFTANGVSFGRPFANTDAIFMKAPAQTVGGAICSRAGTTLTINMPSNSVMSVGRSGSNFNVTGGGNPDPTCGGSTVTNVDTVNVNGTAGNESLQVDQTGGEFAPGASGEISGLSEIEWNINLAGGSDSWTLTGGSAADKFRLGTLGVNVNADDDADQVLTGIENATVSGAGGADQISGEGALSTGNPFPTPLTLSGDAGNDKLTGGAASDVVSGGAGKDTFNALKTADGADLFVGGVDPDTASYGKRAGAVSLDPGGGANDGSPGEGDNIGSDVEKLTGGKGGDAIGDGGLAVANTFKGGAGNDNLNSVDGLNNDTVDGGNGTDTCTTDAGDTRLNCP
jgi:hypothetical protein